MADSWNWPALINKIAQDVPFLQRALNALLKQDPTSIDDAPSGAKRLYEVSSGKWQWQEYNSSSWAAVPFLQHNVDQLDGYHAAITPAANTVAVRNASGLLQDSITGNAATASSAATLSQTLPVNKGGTGATTSAQARTNLGVPPTSHTSTATTYGVGNSTQYGHLKLSDATDSASGATGGIAATPAAVKVAKDAADAAQSSADAAMTKASTLATSSTPGIAKPGTGMTVDAAGVLNVHASSSTTPGLVKSSVAALAGAVPLGSDDGSLGEDWLKKAMEAARNAQTTADNAQTTADNAQTTADEAKSAAESGGKVVSKGTRSTAGNWTISGLTVGKPLYILMDNTANTYLGGVDIRTISGAIGGIGGQGNYYLGRIQGGSGPLTISPPTFIVVPTSTKVVINLYNPVNCKLTAFQ